MSSINPSRKPGVPQVWQTDTISSVPIEFSVLSDEAVSAYQT
jgi:hypothetical protein